MDRIRYLGDFNYNTKTKQMWKYSAENNKCYKYETELECKAIIPQKKMFLSYTDGEDRTPILSKHEAKIIRTREALKRAGIAFRERSEHKYDKDAGYYSRGVDRIESFRTVFEYTVTPESYEPYVRENCRESLAALKNFAEENEAFTKVAGYAIANEFAAEIAEKAAEYVRGVKIRFPDLIEMQIDCYTDERGVAIAHRFELHRDYEINFESRGVKKLRNTEQKAMNDFVTIEICKALNALDETDCVYASPSWKSSDSDVFSSHAQVYYVLDEKNRKKTLNDWQ